MYTIYFSEIATDKITPDEVIKLEILPEKLACNGGKNHIIHNMLTIGEVIEPGKRKLKTWQINSVLEPNGEREVSFYRDMFIHLAETQSPCQFVIIRDNEAFGDSCKIIVEDYEFEDRAGEPGTLYYKLKVSEYIEFARQRDIVGNKVVYRIVPKSRGLLNS